MNLINDTERAAYESAIDDMHDTFARDIKVVNEIKTPIENVSDANDDYDFTHNKNVNRGIPEFQYTKAEKTVKARIKYIDKQDKEFALVNTQEQLNLVQDFGLIRIKVRIADCELVDQCSYAIIDGNHCKVRFRNRPHGLFDSKYCTFYMMRVP